MTDELMDFTGVGKEAETPTEESRQWCESCNELLVPYRRPGSFVYVEGEWVCPKCRKETIEDDGPIRESIDPGTDFNAIAEKKAANELKKKKKQGGLNAPDEDDTTTMISFGKRDPSYDNVIAMSIADREEHQHSPPDFEGSVEDRIRRDIGNQVQNWQEDTFNPVTGKTTTRYYGNRHQRWRL